MRRSSSISAFVMLGAAASLAAATLQGPGTRVTYRVRVVAQGDREVARGSVSGPAGTDLRFALKTDSADIEALFQIVPQGDTVIVAVEFFTKQVAGRSRRGLTLWEQDSYHRAVRLAWGDTARVHLFGRPRGGSRLWIELALERGFSGGEGRPAEELQVVDAASDIRLEAVVRPRRARVILNLVRADTVSGPRGFDLVPDAPPRRVQLAMAGRRTNLEIALTRPEPSPSARDRVLALDADVVCLRVVAPPPPPDVAQPVGVVCGRLNDVARRLPLPGGDTLVATFAWPGGR